MNKQRKICALILGVIAGLTVVNIVLFLCGVFSTLVFALVLAVELISIGFLIWRIVDLSKKLKKKLLLKTIEDMRPAKKEDDPTAIYKELGIPVKYDADGRVLTIYELLGIVPIYDKNGKRVKTIYEELSINPSFNEEGVEIPTVVILKNRAEKIAKIKTASVTGFTRKLTPEQREKLILIKMLREQKEQAEKNGDQEKTKKIEKAITTVKEKSKKKEDFTPAKPKAVKAAGGKAISVKNEKGNNNKVNVDDLLKLFALGSKKEEPKKDNQKPTENKDAENKKTQNKNPVGFMPRSGNFGMLHIRPDENENGQEM